MTDDSQSQYSQYGVSNEKKNRNFFWIIPVLLILIAILVVGVYLVQKQTFYRSSAYSEQVAPPASLEPAASQVDIANCYAFASPLKAKIGGSSIRITVYVLDSQGKGVPGQTVELAEIPGINIDKSNAKTDATGMAFLDISASKPGLYVVEPSVNGKPLNQEISITFEN